MATDSTPTNSKLRWYQFSLRTLFVFVTLCAVPCSWIAIKKEQGRRQKEAVAAIKKESNGWRCEVEYDWQRDANGNPLPNAQPPGSVWLWNVLGKDFFQRVVYVHFYGIEHIKDDDLKHLEFLSELRELSIVNAEVTDAGVKRFQRALPNCRILP